MRKVLPLLSLLLLVGGLASAQMPPPPSPEKQLERLTVLLDLSEQQQTQVAAVLQEQRARMQQHPSPDEMRAKHEQMRQAMLDKMSKILSPQQLKKFEALEDHPAPPFPPGERNNPSANK